MTAEQLQSLHAFRDHVRNFVDSTYILSYVTPWFRDGEWFPAALAPWGKKTVQDLFPPCFSPVFQSIQVACWEHRVCGKISTAF